MNEFDNEVATAVSALLDWIERAEIRMAAQEHMLKNKIDFTESTWKKALEEARNRLPHRKFADSGLPSLAIYLRELSRHS